MNTKKSTFTFIHIPKTGGTSIRAALEPYQDRHEYKFGKYDYAKGHSPVKPIKHLLSPECITFAVVRNTWSRVVSLYLYNEGKHHDLSSKTKEQRQESFAYWIDNNLLAGKVSLSQQQL